MITNDGKELISKYLLGQVPSYASYISFGCGEFPEGYEPTGEEKSMGFEMLRVPISSRSVINDAGDNRISFAGEIPLEQQYIITEVAVWSDGANAAAVNSDSRVLFAFTEDENWRIKDGTQTKDIVYFDEPLSGVQEIGQEFGSINSDFVGSDIFACSADNLTLLANRPGQGARFLNKTIMVPSDTTQKIFIDGRNVDLSTNSRNDLLKFAFAMYPKNAEVDGSFPKAPDVKFTIRFMRDPSVEKNDADPPVGTAVWEGIVPTTKFTVAETTLENVKVSQYGFSWADTRYIEIEAQAGSEVDEVWTPVSGWYIGIDAIRFDNVSTPNPLYVMSGYSVAPQPLVKKANTNAYAEFRFGVDVDTNA